MHLELEGQQLAQNKLSVILIWKSISSMISVLGTASYDYLTADVSHIVIFHRKRYPQVSRYVPPISWIPTLDKSFLCRCPKAADKGSNMFQSFHIASLFLKAQKFSFFSVRILKLIDFGQRVSVLKSLVEEISVRMLEEISERTLEEISVRMPRSECVSAPMPRRHLLLHTHPLPPSDRQKRVLVLPSPTVYTPLRK